MFYFSVVLSYVTMTVARFDVRPSSYNSPYMFRLGGLFLSTSTNGVVISPTVAMMCSTSRNLAG